MCGESWHAMKDSLTHRPSSQGWAPWCPTFFCTSVLFLTLVCTWMEIWGEEGGYLLLCFFSIIYILGLVCYKHTIHVCVFVCISGYMHVCLCMYSISHKKVKVPYRTRTVLLANLERTSSVPLIAQRTHSSVRFGTLRFSAVRGAVRCGRRGTAAVIRAFQHGIDPEPDRGPPNSTWRPFLSRCHNNFVDRVTTLREIENACQ